MLILMHPLSYGISLLDIVVKYPWCLYLLSSYDCRLDTKYPVCNMFKLFMCAVCQVEIKPGEGISIHAGSLNTRNARPWDGPFLCSSCQVKKEAMEGKRPSGSKSIHFLLKCYTLAL